MAAAEAEQKRKLDAAEENRIQQAAAAKDMRRR